MHGGGHAWWGVCVVGTCMVGGACMARGSMHGHGEHAWWGVCMASGGGMHGRGACVAGGMHGGDMHGVADTTGYGQ